MSNCLFEAAFEHILQECKCFPGFHTTTDEIVKTNYSICQVKNNSFPMFLKQKNILLKNPFLLGN